MHGHPLGRPILGTKETVEGLSQDGLRKYFQGVYTAPNLGTARVDIGGAEASVVQPDEQKARESLAAKAQAAQEKQPPPAAKQKKKQPAAAATLRRLVPGRGAA